MTAAAFDIVRDVVLTNRRQGAKASCAVFDAADALGVSPRWITSVLRSEPHAVKPWRMALLVNRYRAWLTAQIEKNERIIAEQRMRIAAMEGGAHAAAFKPAVGESLEHFAAVVGE